MYYALIDRQSEEQIEVLFGIPDTLKALEDRGGNEAIFVRPIMLKSDYLAQSADYRGEIDGRPYLLYLDINQATVYGPVLLLDNWER
ncbi:MAG: hypothetical protein ACE3L7_01790 [Candidatus Pristimantibacillus sp.]